ncbi:nucleotidyltransferase family protein [Singulisphaera acidiphila]|uniref:Putative MobA-like protein n=1 Tax=Singulisphaera acidiphila (strain ATCC BAA-1392 / DSM 18658 / VKM B-2454 / MOB10) TaxID=886293 RepID=L0DE99_SINAD|nr:NTP transferase domain-containing protein [Singulisphaera acidiphila]AGA27577.1 putative MobA-like protein [Singulisphaera acidiphila DSM 18658]
MIAAIVPAAGRSERMGQPKLILSIAGRTVITRVVHALRQGGAVPVVVVTPPRDAPGAGLLIDESDRAGAIVVIAETRPPDMRASFELGLTHLERSDHPSAVILTPADSPGITAALVSQLVNRAEAIPEAILTPTFQGRRGHPIVLPWAMALKSRELPQSAGLNSLVALHASEVVEVEVAEPGVLDDLDTPEDYQRWVPSQ